MRRITTIIQLPLVIIALIISSVLAIAQESAKPKEISKDEIITYLKILNQRNAYSAQFEASMTAQQKQIIEVLNNSTRDLQTELTKLQGTCGKGFTFNESNLVCTINPPAPVETKK